MSEQERFLTALKAMEEKVQTYSADVEKYKDELIGIIVYLMHKHHYTEISIPVGHHRDCVETRTIRLGVGEEAISVIMEAKPQTFDEFVANPPKPDEASTGEMHRHNAGEVAIQHEQQQNWFQLAQAICNPGEEILPAIDRNAI